MGIKPIRIEGNIAFVTLSLGYESVIDAEDAYKVEGFNWTARVKMSRLGAGPTKIYAYRQKAKADGGGVELMHRMLAGTPDGLFTDHINGDGLDNRKCNLRFATVTQNNRNCKRPIQNTSGIKGVDWRESKGKWRAQIKVNNRSLHLGYFDSAEDAAEAYAAGSRTFHGEFGRTV